MTVAKNFQEPVEVLVEPTTQNAKVSQEAVEVIVSVDANARLYQEPIEVVVSPNSTVRVSQIPVETLVTIPTANARISQIAIEVLFIPGGKRMFAQLIQFGGENSLDVVTLVPCFTVCVSTLGTLGVAYIANRQRQEKKANEIRNEREMIQMEMTQASLKLAMVTAKAVTNQKTNGDVEEAMQWAKDVEVKYCKFMRRYFSGLGVTEVT